MCCPLMLGACSEEPQAASDPPAEHEPTPPQQPQSEAVTGTLPDPVPFENDEALDEWFQFYYQHPQPQQVVPAMLLLSESGKLDIATDRHGMAFFFARVLGANDSHASEWADAMNDLPPLHRAFFAQALTLADTEACRAAVQRMADNTEDESLAEGLRQMHKLTLVNPLGMPLDNPGVISLIWAEFAATGNTACIERLASTGHYIIERDDPEMMVVGVKAMHELTINATRHPLVLDTLRRLASEAEGAQQQALHNCIDDAGVMLDQLRTAEEQASEENPEE